MIFEQEPAPKLVEVTQYESLTIPMKNWMCSFNHVTELGEDYIRNIKIKHVLCPSFCFRAWKLAKN